MVDYSGLENRRAERHRGFESLSLRSQSLKPADFQRVLFFSHLEVPFEVPFFFYECLTVNFGLQQMLMLVDHAEAKVAIHCDDELRERH